jgi:GTP-binding protein HflX
MELLVPYAEGGSLSELHELAGEIDREDTERGARIRARVPVGVARRFERFELNGADDGASADSEQPDE